MIYGALVLLCFSLITFITLQVYCLFRAWFSSNIEERIMESANTFWFMDDDWCYEDKISKLIN